MSGHKEHGYIEAGRLSLQPVQTVEDVIFGRLRIGQRFDDDVAIQTALLLAQRIREIFGVFGRVTESQFFVLILTDADRQPLTRAIERVREAAKGDDVSSIKSAIDELEQASHAFSKSIYESAQAAHAQEQPQYTAAGGNGSSGSGSGETSDDAIDAEFEVKT